MRSFCVLAALAAAIISFNCRAEELGASKAEELLQPAMATDCGSYYTTQGEPDFSNLEGKSICTYRPKVTRIANGDGSATVEYTHDRQFDNDLSAVWLNDFSKMETHKTPSLLFKKLKSNLEMWLAKGGFDRGYRPAKATFKLYPDGWRVVAAP